MAISIACALGSSAVRTRTQATIGAISGKRCVRYCASSSGGALPAEATSGGEKRWGRPGNSLKPMKCENQFTMFTQWSTLSAQRMCSASRPERGAVQEDGMKEDEMTEESPVWMTLAFAAITAMIEGHQEKWVRMGDL